MFLGQTPSVEGVAWSPKDDEVWFVAGAGNNPSNTLHAVTRSGKHRLLESFLGLVQLQDISRDGRVIITQISNRSGITFVSNEQEPGRDLSWLDFSSPTALSTDGKVLLFYEGGYGGGVGGSTYIRNTDGSPAIRLGEGNPQALSPDGKWVLSHLYLQNPTKLVLYPVGAGETRAFDLNGLEFDGGAEWLRNGNQILFQGHEPGHASRVYKKELPNGKPVAITPEIGLKGPVSPDEKFILLFDSDRKAFLYQFEGGQRVAIKGSTPSALANVISWAADSRSLYVSDQDGQSGRIYRFDPFTGQQQDWKALRPPDPAGLVGFSNIVISPDGKSYAFGYVRVLGDLYLVEGLKY
jgi:eukaryotic-like serine/threonine-protein kinase